MEEKLFDSERKVMEVIWEAGDIPAREIALKLHEKTGWNKNTTYTVIKKCIQKGWIDRLNPALCAGPEFPGSRRRGMIRKNL